MKLNNRTQRTWIKIAAIVSAVNVLVSPVASLAATRNWDGDTSTAWGTAANWDTAPGNNLTSDIANFNLATYGGSVYAPNAGTVSIGGITIGGSNGAMPLDSTTLSIGASGISMASGAGAFTLNSGTTTLGFAQTWANASGSAFDIKTTLARSAGVTLNFNNTGAGSFTTSNNSVTLTNGIIGPWATYGTGTLMKYATVSGTTIQGLTGTAAATGTNLNGVQDGTVNYDLAAGGGTVPATVSANTIRYTGGVGTTAPGATSFTVNGLMNVGSGLWTIGTNPLTIGANKELVITGPSDITISSKIQDNAGGASSLTYSGAGTLMLTSSANNFSGGLTLNSGVLMPDPNVDNVYPYIGTGALTLAGGRFQFKKVASVNFTNNVIVSGSATIRCANSTGQLPSFTGNWTINPGAGTLTFDSAYAVTHTSTISNPVTMNADLTLVATSSAGAVHNVTLTGGIALSGAPRTLTLNNTTTVSIAGPLSNTVGAGTALTLAGSGAVTVGALTASGANSTGVTINSTTGGVYTFNGASTYTGGTTLTSGKVVLPAWASSTPTSGTVISGPFGTGTITLAGGTLDGGDMNDARTHSLGNALVLAGGTSTLSCTGGNNNTSTWNFNGSLSLPDSSVLTLKKTIGGKGNIINFSGLATLGSGVSLTVQDNNDAEIWHSLNFAGGIALSGSNATITNSGPKTTTTISSAVTGSGTLTVRVNGGAFAQNADITNGIAVVNGGTYTPANSMTLKAFVYNSGTFTLPVTALTLATAANGGYIGGTGTITSAMLGNLTNNGSGLYAGDPTGALNSTGKLGTLTITPTTTYALNNNGTIYFNIAGTGDVTGTDRGLINISGGSSPNFTAGANANVVAYNPNGLSLAGTTYTFLTHAGTFAGTTTWNGKIVNTTSTTVNWTEPSGSDHLWITGTNWDLPGYLATVNTATAGQIKLVTGSATNYAPFPTSDVIIDKSATITGPTGATTIVSLTLGDIGGTYSPTLTLQSGGNLAVSGNVAVNAGSTLTATAAALTAASLTSSGAVSLGTGTSITGTTTINNGTFNASAGTLGTLTVNGGTVGGTALSATITTANFLGGTSTVTGGTISGTLTANSGSTSYLNGGTVGTLAFNGGTSSIGGATVSIGNIAASGLTLNSGSIGTATVTGGGITTTGGTIGTFNHNTGAGTSTIGSGTTITTAANIASGNVTFNSTQTANGTLRVTGGSTTIGSGAVVKQLDISSPGSATLDATSALKIQPALSSDTAIQLGNNVTGKYNSTGGTAYFQVSGSNAASAPLLTLSGGTLTLSTPSSARQAFTANGTLTVPTGGYSNARILLVGGGGGGGAAIGGGGGGGAVVWITSANISAGDYTVTVGTSGGGGYGAYTAGTATGGSGGNTTLTKSGFTTVSAAGGGGGGRLVTGAGVNGGSGGGAGGSNASGEKPIGGNGYIADPTVHVAYTTGSSLGDFTANGTIYGNAGGDITTARGGGGGTGDTSARGGGGAGAPATDGAAAADPAGAGGVGFQIVNASLGSYNNLYWGGGGGGAAYKTTAINGGDGGLGGGGGGATFTAGLAGTGGGSALTSGGNGGTGSGGSGGAGGANTGGGGGGGTWINTSSSGPGGAGGSGFALVAWDLPANVNLPNTAITATASSTLDLGASGSEHKLGNVSVTAGAGANTTLTVNNVNTLTIGTLTIGINGAYYGKLDLGTKGLTLGKGPTGGDVTKLAVTTVSSTVTTAITVAVAKTGSFTGLDGTEVTDNNSKKWTVTVVDMGGGEDGLRLNPPASGTLILFK